MSTETASAPVAAPAVSTPKGKAKKAAGTPKVKKPKVAPTHPPTATMVNKAITDLKEKGGSSLIAIKKIIGSTYKVDTVKLAPFIKKYLVSAVAAGKLVQTKGKGASGSFKLATKEKSVKPKKEKKPKAAKKPAAKKVKKAAAKPKAAKKPAAAKKPKAASKPKTVKPKTPKKAIKAKKPAVKKAAPKKK